MSDIERRLRQWGEYNCEHLPSHTEELLQEAADHIAALEARNARLEEQVREAYERCAKIADEAVEEGKRWKSPTRWTAASIAQAIRTLTTEQTNG